MMSKEHIKDLAFWIMILVVIGMSIYVIVYFKSESFQCMNDPLVYGVRTYLPTSDGENLQCTCGYESLPFNKLIVTKEGIENKQDFLGELKLKPSGGSD